MMQVKTEIRPSPIHGLGCFAADQIAEGQIIWKFVDGVDHEPQHLNDFVGDARYINHSGHPNTAAREDGDTYALRLIRAGEEITEDYEQTVPELAGGAK